jgi:hypothetical protein
MKARCRESSHHFSKIIGNGHSILQGILYLLPSLQLTDIPTCLTKSKPQPLIFTSKQAGDYKKVSELFRERIENSFDTSLYTAQVEKVAKMCNKGTRILLHRPSSGDQNL